MAHSTVTISDLRHWNALQKGEDGGHSTTTVESPTIGPQRHHPKIFFPTWDNIFIISSAFSLFVDPLICYIPFVVEENTCYLWDLQLMWTILALRSIGDLYYAMDVVVFLKRLRAKRSAKSSAGASSTKTNDDHLVTTLRNFIHKKPIRFFAILLRIWVALPFLQAILLTGWYTYWDNYMLISLIPFQYILRAYNLYKWLDRHANAETVTRRFLKAILDFLPFIIASHLYGSMWYFFAANTEIICWQDYICKHEQKCDIYIFVYSFYCDYSPQLKTEINITRVKLSCPVELPKNMTLFPHDYGIYLSALQSNMLTSRYLPRKILHCFWWGLRNLSSFGSNLQTSFSTEEIIFSIVISISGLILFLVYLNSRVQGFQKIAKQRRLKRKIKTKYSALIDQIFIMRLLRMDSLKKVAILGSIDEKVLKAISEHLKPVIYAEDEYIIREGEPLRKILFIRQGTALTYTTSKSGTSVCRCLEKNDLYGEELVVWALQSASFSELPICSTTLVSQSKVNAFSITANHLKSVIAEFWWHLRRELPHSQVEYFAASSMQAAWRRHHAKKLRDQPAGTNN